MLSKIFNALIGTAEERQSYQSLINAIKKNDIAQVTKLLESGFDQNKPVGIFWRHPLDICLEKGTAECFKEMLDKGGDPNGKIYKGRAGVGTDVSLLLRAIMMGKKDFAVALLDDPRTDVTRGGIIVPAQIFAGVAPRPMRLPSPLEAAKNKGYNDLVGRIEQRIRQKQKSLTVMKPHT